MNTVEEKLTSNPPKTIYDSCLETIVILLLAALVIATLPFVINFLSVFVHRRQWDSHRIEDYTLILVPAGYSVWGDGLHPNGTTLIVRDGIVIDVINAPLTQLSVGLAFYQKYTIYGMFDQANSCVIFCGVQYDNTYGFPKRIGGGFIEGGWFEVIDFQIDTPNS